MRLVLTEASTSAAELDFYSAAEWQTAWDADTARQLREAIVNRSAHGLDHVTFDTGDTATGTAPEAANVARTRAALAYAVRLGRTRGQGAGLRGEGQARTGDDAG